MNRRTRYSYYWVIDQKGQVNLGIYEKIFSKRNPSVYLAAKKAISEFLLLLVQTNPGPGKTNDLYENKQRTKLIFVWKGLGQDSFWNECKRNSEMVRLDSQSFWEYPLQLSYSSHKECRLTKRMKIKSRKWNTIYKVTQNPCSLINSIATYLEYVLSYKTFILWRSLNCTRRFLLHFQWYCQLINIDLHHDCRFIARSPLTVIS